MADNANPKPQDNQHGNQPSQPLDANRRGYGGSVGEIREQPAAAPQQGTTGGTDQGSQQSNVDTKNMSEGFESPTTLRNDH